MLFLSASNPACVCGNWEISGGGVERDEHISLMSKTLLLSDTLYFSLHGI